MNEFELSNDAFLRTLKENTDTGHVFLLGAGASISSGIQSANDCIWEWKKNIFITKNPNLAQYYNEYKSESVQRSIQRWLDNEGSYPEEGSIDEYSFYALRAYPIDEIRRKYFENICRGKEPHLGYKILCLLAKYGMVKSVFTTNFDGLIEKASHQTGLTPISVSLDTPERIHRTSNNQELLCIALHGDFKYGPLKNTGPELDTQHEYFSNALEQHLYDKHLVVIGYSGRDKSLMDALKKAYSKPGAGMLFWCGYGYDMNSDIKDLLIHISSNCRKGFYIPTEGFDTTLIHVSKTCFDKNEEFAKDVSKILQNNQDNGFVKTPFTIDVGQENVLLKSNLFPITLPTEVFQFDMTFNEGEKIWSVIRELTKDKQIVGVPLNKLVYAFGIQTKIREAISSRLKGEIKRTPVTYNEIKDGSVFKNLYLKAIIDSICQLYNLQTDGFEKIYIQESKITQNKNGIIFDLYDAVELGLFFDNKSNAEKPFAYLSIKPTFYIKSDTEIPKLVKLETGKNYYETLLKGQPNVKFNDQIDKWKSLIFPHARRLQFEYPLNSGTGFQFSISSNTMHTSLTKVGGGYPLRLPNSFDKRLILHKGIQFSEPNLEFVDKNTGQIVKDFHPMRGLIKNKPYDFSLNGNVFDPEINIGIICPNNHKNSLYDFLNRLNKKQTAGVFNPDYLMDYPGFINAYGIPFNIPDVNSDLWKDCIINFPPNNIMQTANELADKIKKAIDYFDAVNKKLVLVIFIPTDWNIITDINNEEEKFDLHDYIKAYAAQKQIATQFIQESTLSDTLVCQINWWLSLSFYVKAQRTPWVLNGLESNTAFVGIGYSVNRRKDKNKVVLGCSHIYNSFGQGLKYKLSRVEDCYIDKQNNPFLSYQDAYKFGTLIRELFFNAMGEIPKRVVVHKRTHFKKDEIKGIVDSLKKSGVQQIDLIEINFEENARFISLYVKNDSVIPGMFPLSRGSCFLLDNSTALLWTHGIVPSIKADNRSYYLGGKNIPIPLHIKKHYGSSNIGTVATEILGLTKMNWNSFDLYSKLPTTIQTSNEIARIGWLLNRFEGKTYDYRNFM
jgi:NAD-dependent SIR2 family protein deacetylase